MRVRLEPGKRYRLRCRMPKLIEPRTVVAMLARDVRDVLISDPVAGVVTIEATWRGALRTVDTEFVTAIDVVANR